MALRSRTRLQLRRTVVVAALGALFVPAVADAKTKTPVITKVTPKVASVGTKITIEGKNFRRGKAKNSVLFRRDKGKALFVKSDVSTTKKLTVIVPKTLEKYMLTKGGVAVPTRFRLRVLASKLTKAYSAANISPVIGPEKPAGNSSSDGAGVPTAPACPAADPSGDNDGDLLKNSEESSIGTLPCSADTDLDGVEDGYEYQSALDLNVHALPSPDDVLKTGHPDPLVKDADKDADGDGLVLLDEYMLWKYTNEVNQKTPTLSGLSYSDGKQYSEDQNVSDDERDADADGLTNYHETHGWMTPQFWAACYPEEGQYPIPYAGTKVNNPDSDGDGVLDGADDQDFDGVPNIMELSRVVAGRVAIQGKVCVPATGATPYTNPMANAEIWVQPFNPCLPDENSRTCPIHRTFGQAYAPFIDDWKPFVLN